MIDIDKMIGSIEGFDVGFLEDMILSFICETALEGKISPDDYPDLTLNDFGVAMDATVYKTLRACALEFICTNEYGGEDQNDFRSAVDEFLEDNSESLPDDLLGQYSAFRNSYMGLYQVIELDSKQAILKDMIDQDQPNILIQGKLSPSNNKKIDVGDAIGARILKTKNKNFLTEGTLFLSKETCDTARSMISMMNTILLDDATINLFKAELDNPDLLVKKLWSKEIVQSWYFDLPKDRKVIVKNKDGHQLQFFTLQFPIHSSKSDIVSKLNTLPDMRPVVPPLDNLFGRHKLPEVTAWNYVLPMEEKFETNSIMIDKPAWGEDFEELYVCARISLEDQTLVIQVNSKERTDSISTFIQKKLGKLIGKPKIIEQTEFNKADPELHEFFAQNGLDKKVIESAQQMMDSLFRENMSIFLDQKTPDLGNKTPREALKIKEERSKVIMVLSMMSQSFCEECQKLYGAQTFQYDMNWLWNDLEIKPEEVASFNELYEKMKDNEEFKELMQLF